MPDAGAMRVCCRTLQLPEACTLRAAPGAMISAAAAFATPSTESCPAVLEFNTNVAVLEARFQPGETTYHSGSPAASRSFSSPSVRQGNRPTAGNAQNE